MTKTLTLLALCALSSIATARADAPQIKISSWHQVEINNPNNTAAEVCGSVTGTLTGQEHVLVTVDPKYNPGEYTTLLSPNKNFCQVVSTATGQVEAALVSPTGQVLAKSNFSAK